MTRNTITRRRVDPEKVKTFMKRYEFTTQSEFAKYCGISEKTFRRMLAEREAPLTVCYSVAVSFGRPFDDIFGPDDSEEMVLWRMCLRA